MISKCYNVSMETNDTENCIFCRIASKKSAAYIVYDDADFVAFLDIHPQAPGHALIIPKKHYRWVWDVPNIGRYFEIAAKIAQAQRKAFGTDWILSRIVGEECHHAHIWVFPNSNVAGDKNDFEGNKAKIIAAL